MAQAQKSAPTRKSASTSSTASTLSSGSIQEFVFPATSIGTLSKCLVRNWQTVSAPEPFTAAIGHVTLKLAPGEASCLRYNSRILRSPELMDKFSADKLDGIWIDFMNMENEKSVSDHFVARCSRFPHLKFLLIDRSDATDVGLLQLPLMPELHVIHASMSAVTGKFLEHADRFPGLRCLVLFNTPINSQSLSNLPKLTNLIELDLHHTNLKPAQ